MSSPFGGGSVVSTSKHLFNAREHSIPVVCAVQVRKICCACLVKLYRKGDTLPLYARVSSLQGFLSSKEVRSSPLHHTASAPTTHSSVIGERCRGKLPVSASSYNILSVKIRTNFRCPGPGEADQRAVAGGGTGGAGHAVADVRRAAGLQHPRVRQHRHQAVLQVATLQRLRCIH